MQADKDSRHEVAQHKKFCQAKVCASTIYTAKACALIIVEAKFCALVWHIFCCKAMSALTHALTRAHTVHVFRCDAMEVSGRRGWQHI